MSSISLPLECDENPSPAFKRCLPRALPMSFGSSSTKKRRRCIKETPNAPEEPEISAREMEDFLILKQVARENRPSEAMSVGEAMTNLTKAFASDDIATDFGTEVQQVLVKTSPKRHTPTRVCNLRLRWQLELGSTAAIRLVDFFIVRGGAEGLVEGVQGPIGARCFCGSDSIYKTAGMCNKHMQNFMRLRNKFIDLLFRQNDHGFHEWLVEQNLQHQE